MVTQRNRLGTITVVAGLMVSTSAMADTLKVGVVGPMTGPLAVMGEQWRQGIETFMELNGDKAGDTTIEVVYRDTTGNPANAKQMAQELIVRERVQALVGFGISPSAAAAAPVINEVQIPTFLPHVASPALMDASPYFVRLGQNIATNAEVAAKWARENGMESAYVAVADYAPGHDVANAFKPAFEGAGGTVTGSDNIPLSTVDFSPFAERIAEAQPDMVQLFIPPGAQAVSMVKAMAARGLMEDTLIMGQGEAEDSDIHLFDGTIKNFHSAIYYSESLDNPENEAFVGGLQAKFGEDVLPSTFTLGAYDSMALIYALATEMGADFNGDAVMAKLAGYSWASPRGKITLDAESREPIQDFVIRRVEDVDGQLRNVVVDTIPQVHPISGS